MDVENIGTDIESESAKQYLNAGLDYNNKTLPLPLLAALFAVFCKGSDSDLHQSGVYSYLYTNIVLKAEIEYLNILVPD